MIAKAIRDYLAARLSVDVFYSQVPASPDNEVTILSYYGFPPDVKFAYSYPRFQIRSRAILFDDAESVAMQCFTYLQNLTHITMSGIEIIEIKALQDPYLLEYDEKNRAVFQQNFEAHVYYPTLYRE